MEKIRLTFAEGDKDMPDAEELGTEGGGGGRDLTEEEGGE